VSWSGRGRASGVLVRPGAGIGCASPAGGGHQLARDPAPRVPTPRQAPRDGGGPARPGSRAPRRSRFRCGPCAGRSRGVCGWRVSACSRAGPGRVACAGQNKTRSPPCMRCRGPCLASPHQVGQSPGLSRRCAPPARVRNSREGQVSLLLPRPGVASGQCPFLTVKAFLLPPDRTAQDLDRIFSRLFSCPHAVHKMLLVIRIKPAFSTCFPPSCAQEIHRLPAVARRNTVLPLCPPGAFSPAFQFHFPAFRKAKAGD
jgi:hypothetical protein